MPRREWTVELRHMLEEWMRQIREDDFETEEHETGLPQSAMDDWVEVDRSWHSIQAYSEFGAALEVLDRAMESRRELDAPAAIAEGIRRHVIALDLEAVGPGAWRYELFSERFDFRVCPA